ncbi:hypothetical protein JZ751_013997, partial [Albula glossodonta]
MSVAVLECETRQPAVRVTWLKGLVALTAGSKYDMKQQGTILSLTIKHLERRDSKKVIIMEELEDTECLEGDTVVFKCRICPSDYSNIRWYRNSTLLCSDHKNEIHMLPEGCHLLAMKSLARRDSGTICFQAGDKRSYASLLVKERRPTITKELEDYEAMEGEDVVLACQTSKSCHILWYKDGCLIWNSSKYCARRWDNEASLTIHSVN